MEKKENPIFGNIQYKPKIWGLSYVHLFGTFGAVLMTLTLLRGFGLLVNFGLGIGIGILLYTYFFYVDNYQDKANQHLKGKIKKRIVSYEPSNWRIKIKK